MLRRTAAVVLTGALGLGGLALLAPSPAGAATDQLVASADSAQQKALNPGQRHQLREKGHVTVTRHTRKHGTVTVIVQRGEVTAVSATSVTLKSKDGWTHSYVLTDKTRVRGEGDVAVGDRAQVIAVKGKDGDVARRLRHRAPQTD